MRQLLSDVAVVEVSTEPAGSYCAKVFADLGADVVKVEPPSGDPQRGHPERVRPPEHEQAQPSSLRDDESGREQLMELLGSADLVVESHGVGDLQGFGICAKSCARNMRRWSSRPSAASVHRPVRLVPVVGPGRAGRVVDDLPPRSIARGAGEGPTVSSRSARSVTPLRSARWPASSAPCTPVRAPTSTARPTRLSVPFPRVCRYLGWEYGGHEPRSSRPTRSTPCSPPGSSRAPTATCR